MFDNCQFVDATELFSRPRVESIDAEFALAALQEIPDQFEIIKEKYL